MRAAVEGALRALWSREGGAGSSLLAALALPAELAFRAGVSARGAAYERGLLAPRRATVSVISVGNLAVGGAGKTPLARWVARLLADAGHHPAIILRGYGRDEALLHRGWNPDVPVIVDADRARGAIAAVAIGAKCIVLDDGFQHRHLARDLDVVAVAAERRFPGPLLPRGPYREPAGALVRAQVVVVTHRASPLAAVDRTEAAVRRAAPGALLVRARLAAASWRDLAGAPAPPPTGEVLAVAGIAGPEAFAALVAGETGARPRLLAFPDHHEFSSRDLERIRDAAEGGPVAVTEKDAVKLREHSGALPDARVLALSLTIEAGAETLRQRILAAADGRKA